MIRCLNPHKLTDNMPTHLSHASCQASAPEFHADCFACGQENEHGMQMTFTTSGDHSTGLVVIDRRFQGYEGIAQGGIVATILDSAMVRMLHDLFGGNPLTGRLSIRYLEETPLHAPLMIHAHLIDRRGNVCRAEAEILHEHQRCATASGVFKLHVDRQ
jgi:acyl-coenzyme A thioesterase PaaI-like protein